MQNKNKCRSFSSKDEFHTQLQKAQLYQHQKTKNKETGAQEALCPSRKRNVPHQEREEGKNERKEGRREKRTEGGRRKEKKKKGRQSK